jgi:hypothetical protein
MEASMRMSTLFYLLYGYLVANYSAQYAHEYLGETASAVETLLIEDRKPNGEYSDLACDAWLFGKQHFGMFLNREA